MSNIGKMYIQLPQNTYSVYTLEKNSFICAGRLGMLEFAQNNNFYYNYNKHSLCIIPKRQDLSMQWGLLVALLKQLYCGIYRGFSQRLELAGLGFKCTSIGMILQFKLGFSHIKEYTIARTVNIKCVTSTVLNIRGILASEVYLTAFKLSLLRIPDVYKHKGIKYPGKYLIKKQGKKKK